jgi:hypothetical protein
MTIKRSKTVIPPTLPTTAPATIGVLVDGGPGTPAVLLFALPVAEAFPTASVTAPPGPTIRVLEEVEVSKLDDSDDEDKRLLEIVDEISEDVLEVIRGPASELLAPVEDEVIELWVELKAGGKSGIRGLFEAVIEGPGECISKRMSL